MSTNATQAEARHTPPDSFDLHREAATLRDLLPGRYVSIVGVDAFFPASFHRRTCTVNIGGTGGDAEIRSEGPDAQKAIMAALAQCPPEWIRKVEPAEVPGLDTLRAEACACRARVDGYHPGHVKPDFSSSPPPATGDAAPGVSTDYSPPGSAGCEGSPPLCDSGISGMVACETQARATLEPSETPPPASFVVGERYAAGDGAVFEVTEIRNPDDFDWPVVAVCVSKGREYPMGDREQFHLDGRLAAIPCADLDLLPTPLPREPETRDPEPFDEMCGPMPTGGAS